MMNLRQQIRRSYDQVYAPEDAVERLKQELYQTDLQGDAESEIFRVEEARHPAIGQYVLYIAAVFALCFGVGMFWKYAQTQKNELRPGSQVVVETETVEAPPDWVNGTVPDVTNYHYEYARNMLEQMGYVVMLQNENDDDVEPSHVIRTDPAAGSVLPQGEAVTLYVSQGGTGEVEMQDCVGMTLEQARTLLEYYGISVLIAYDEKADEQPGTVIAQDIDAGNILQQYQSTVTLTVSGEREMLENAVYLESLIGMSEQDAAAVLTAHELTYQITREPSDAKRGEVIAQSVIGYFLDNDTVIELTVAE